jgi:hypothetical protein
MGNSGFKRSQTVLNYQDVYSVVAGGSNIFAGTGGGVYYSTDNGQTWGISLNDRTVYSLAIRGANIFAGTLSNGVYTSTNNGQNWVQTSLSYPTVLSLCANGSYVFAGSYGGLYVSNNNGQTWSQSLMSMAVNSIVTRSSNVFAGTSSGFYVSTNNGLSWSSKNEGLEIIILRSIALTQDYIFAGIEGRSVWKRHLAEIIGIHPISKEIPNEFYLSQNYPNPFNPVTKIRFDISPLPRGVSEGRGGLVKLIIFGILGKEIATVVNESLLPGTYEVQWDGTNFPSGVYLYRLSAGNYVETKRMVLLK